MLSRPADNLIMAFGQTSGFHDPFAPLLFKVLSIPYPSTWDNDNEVEQKELHALAVLEAHLKEHHKQIAALILEPLVQGASGMRMCRPDYLKKVLERVRSYGILIIYDEIMTGFGRTGTLFALEQLDLTPDFLCVSKGITGGFLRKHCPFIKNTRIIGTISAFDVDSKNNLNAVLKKCFLEAGFLIRPLGNTIYLLPPYSITTDELEGAYSTIAKTVRQACKN